MIDWNRVRDLRAEIGEADFAEVAALFLEECDEVMVRLSTDRGALLREQDLHFLKGAALNLGFTQLAALCQAGERHAATGAGTAPLDPVRAAYAVARRGLLADLAKQTR